MSSRKTLLMIISNQAPVIFRIAFSEPETVDPDTYHLFVRSMECINGFLFRGFNDVPVSERVSLSSPWWEQIKQFRNGIHPLVQLTGTASTDLASRGFDMTPELDVDTVVRIWNAALKSLRREL